MSAEVIVYTSSHCPLCLTLKAHLNDWGVHYEERNVSENKDFFEQLQQKRIFGTPATYINGKVTLGFQPDKIKKLLGISEENIC